MLDAKMYLNELVEALKKTFGDRLVYVGLQGSYLRGEATDSSDIDPMVVIDGLSVSDLKTYRAIVETLPEPDKSCGFLCGREELSCWNPLEISHLLHTTRDLYGVLTALVPLYNERDMRSFIQLSIGNLYHELCHRYVHASAEDNRSKLPFTCKGVFFILQNLYHLRTGIFCNTKQELLLQLSGDDLAVLQLSLQRAPKNAEDVDAAIALLLGWCRQTLAGL